MQDFGAKLRRAREGRGVSLRQIAATTKISVSALEALERNDVSKLPGGLFSRAFVRSYAAEIGLDPEQTLNEFLERFGSDPLASPPSARASDDEIAFERRKLMAARVFLLALAVMLALAGAFAYYLLRNRPV
jgi:cytoskeletal protein RodZ